MMIMSVNHYAFFLASNGFNYKHENDRHIFSDKGFIFSTPYLDGDLMLDDHFYYFLLNRGLMEKFRHQHLFVPAA